MIQYHNQQIFKLKNLLLLPIRSEGLLRPPLFYLLRVISNNYLKIAAVYYFHLGDIYQVGVRRGTPPPADRGRSQDTRHVARGSGDTFKLLKALSPRLLFIGDTR